MGPDGVPMTCSSVNGLSGQDALHIRVIDQVIGEEIGNLLDIGLGYARRWGKLHSA